MPDTFSVPGAPAAFATAAVEQRLELHSLANEKRAYTLGAVKLVRGQRHQVHAHTRHVERDFARGLHRVAVKPNAGLRGNAANLRDRLKRTEFVIRVHHGDQNGFRPQRAPDIIRVHHAIATDRHASDRNAPPLERLAGVQHRVMLDGRGDDMPSRSGCGLRGMPAIPPTTPKIARLSASVPPLVKTISLGRAPIRAATEARARSTAPRALWPNEWTEFGLPYSAEKYGSIAARTSGSTGVVAL